VRYLGDGWERGYGDMEWRGRDDQRVMPWYFLSYDGKVTDGWGVKTGASAMCFWQRDGGGINLWIDVRNGTRGVSLGGRELLCCKIVSRKGKALETPFMAAREFCKSLCDNPRTSPLRIYGGNDRYYCYGDNSAKKILRDAEFLSEMSGGIDNRPFTVVDAGWQYFKSNCGGGPWHSGNENFGDMGQLADGIGKRGCRAGIWYRPLTTTEKLDGKYYFAERNFAPLCPGDVMDPSRDVVLEKVYEDARRFNEWGYELIKHDFSTYDIFGKWGFQMGEAITGGEWRFADEGKTSAEIIRNFYQTIREGAGEMLVLGCNTVGHLGAGIFDINRTGDDNGSDEWDRTRKIAINTLGFRMSQHGTFFTADPDCVAITKGTIWPMSRQLLDLFSKSGTMLFISTDCEKLNSEQKGAIKAAFENINKNNQLGEPLDWMDSTCPRLWKLAGEKVKYDWYGE
ncbi:MAG TPA: hypothetical protein PLP05_01420, partial [Sedimentisphaerales bacterium]|nr:hypothetical protein [Sedimentisphaerales bacterium]